jgi:hypothetical protein
MIALFPDMAEELRLRAEKAAALLDHEKGRAAWVEVWTPEPRQQTMLLTGLDCLAGQQDLIETNGEKP